MVQNSKPVIGVLISVALAILFILIGGVTYLLTRSCDYRAYFTVKTTPDIVYFNILNWNIWNRSEAAATIEITAREPVQNISQTVLLNDTTLLFDWEINQLNDSVTAVRVCVSDPERGLYNRLTVPFFNTPFKKSVRGNLLDIERRLQIMLKTFRYSYTGHARFKETACVYININSTIRGKAMSMISTVTELNQFVKQHNLGLDGYPFVVVHGWNELSDSINFDFCFPVKQVDAVPEHPFIRFRSVEAMDAVKTDFYGNYSISDISWHHLAEQANKLGYRTNHELIEVYHHDPHSGGNELEWKAEIFLGIESREELQSNN
jgi:effector-binding domain-containing protein